MTVLSAFLTAFADGLILGHSDCKYRINGICPLSGAETRKTDSHREKTLRQLFIPLLALVLMGCPATNSFLIVNDSESPIFFDNIQSREVITEIGANSRKRITFVGPPCFAINSNNKRALYHWDGAYWQASQNAFVFSSNELYLRDQKTGGQTPVIKLHNDSDFERNCFHSE